jgi:MscS family membrane protein
MLPLARALLEWLGWHDAGPWPVGITAALLVVAATMLAGFLVTGVLGRALRRLAARTETDLDDRLLEITRKPVRRLLVAAGLYEVTMELPLAQRTWTILSGLVLVYGVWIAAKLVTQVALVLLSAYAKRVADHDQFRKDYFPLLSKVIGLILGIIGLMIVLGHFGKDVTSLVAALGIGGVAVSLAAKDTLGSMIAGFVILLDRPFRPGDRIRLASGEIGDVVDIGTRSTRVQLLDQNLLVVPNNELVNSRVVNFNFPAHSSGVSLEIRLPYGSDLEKARKICADILAGQQEIVQPPPAPALTSFAPDHMVLTVSFTVPEYTLAGPVVDRVRSEIHEKLYAAGLRFGTPTSEMVHGRA